MHKVTICADIREKRSGIPAMLDEQGCELVIKTLKAGDYIINEHVIVERKSKDDFVLSLIQDRLFRQCAAIKQSHYIPTLLIEGNPYHTLHIISREAIRGALLSVSLSWQIPVNYSANIKDTVELLMMIAQQNIKDTQFAVRNAYKPKNLKKQQLYFLQGLPWIGAKLASALFQYFGSIQQVILANEDELARVEGIGKGRARKIREFINKSW
jgi:Fanconi anemia group M protein